ncbi:hypothetical protein X777_10526, partial [Ooceraea biroi]
RGRIPFRHVTIGHRTIGHVILDTKQLDTARLDTALLDTALLDTARLDTNLQPMIKRYDATMLTLRICAIFNKFRKHMLRVYEARFHAKQSSTL